MSKKDVTQHLVIHIISNDNAFTSFVESMGSSSDGTPIPILLPEETPTVVHGKIMGMKVLPLRVLNSMHTATKSVSSKGSRLDLPSK